jgi:hypothetical protein
MWYWVNPVFLMSNNPNHTAVKILSGVTWKKWLFWTRVKIAMALIHQDFNRS